MKIVSKVLTVAVIALVGVHSFAATPQEAPPREPPYTDDSEFDSVLSEDPSASTSPIPVSPSVPAPNQIEKSPETKVSKGYSPSYSEEVDKTPRKGVKLIHHPDAKKGLVRIESDGTYIYKVKTTPKDQSGSFRFGFMDPPNILSADRTTDFKTMYGADPIPVLMFDYEWQPFSKYGKLGVQAGFGVAFADGRGRFLKDGTEAQEKYNFVIAPLNVGVIYRLEYFKRQWVAPYIAGGGTYFAVAEMRDDGKNNFSGTPAAYGAGGLMFNITAIDKSMAYNLDSEYGIGNLWLVAEYRLQQAFSEDLDFSGGLMSLGISADF